MSTAHQVTDAAAIRSFILAGRATFTIVNPTTGGRFTYKVAAPTRDTDDGGKATDHDARVRFVKLLTGSDNTEDYTFLGTIFLDDMAVRGGSSRGFVRGPVPAARPRFNHSQKSRIGRDAPGARAFAWFWERLVSGLDLRGVQFWHEGHCGRCGRALTVPESIAQGLGPECAERAA